jgi:hypothetical protein
MVFLSVLSTLVLRDELLLPLAPRHHMSLPSLHGVHGLLYRVVLIGELSRGTCLDSEVLLVVCTSTRTCTALVSTHEVPTYIWGRCDMLMGDIAALATCSTADSLTVFRALCSRAWVPGILICNNDTCSSGHSLVLLSALLFSSIHIRHHWRIVLLIN